MKTLPRRIVAVLAGCTFVLALLTAVNAADQVKGGERQLQMLKPIKTAEEAQAIKDGDMVAMACPKCKTISFSYVDSTARGANKEVKTVTKDACPGCDTKIVTTGVGKQAKNEIVHTCKDCGSHDAFCCVLKKEDKRQ